MVTEGIFHGLHKVVIQSCFFVACVYSNGYRSLAEVNEGCLLVTNVCSTVILRLQTMSTQWSCARSVKGVQDLGQYEASGEAVPPPSKTPYRL